jgi:hypothetical protein
MYTVCSPFHGDTMFAIGLAIIESSEACSGQI